MIDYFLKGILIGLVFGLPVGAIGIMTVQRTLSHGLKAGLLTGLGSSVADCIYATIGVFGVTLATNFLLAYQKPIHMLGGSVLLLLGIRLFLKQAETAFTHVRVMGRLKLFLSSFIVGATNPAAIITFLFAFSYFGITDVAAVDDGLALVLGVFLGTYLWWGCISFATYKVKQKVEFCGFKYGNRFFGIILALFGGGVLVQSFFYI